MQLGGQSIRFKESDVRDGSHCNGSDRGKARKGDSVVGADVIKKGFNFYLVMTDVMEKD